jgi:UDP-N-acetylmuramate: L-alanyl-gamma-D-glutamyl-meso-diaminopimelate ligase
MENHNLKHIHLIGICGTAMASLAGLLKTQGFKVTGSDQNVYPPMSTQLQELGIQIMEGYKAENLCLNDSKNKPDLVIVGNVISRGNAEASALLQSDIPYTSLPKAMGQFAIADRHCIVVAGTHGKTTTTSMMVRAADACEIKPGFMVGGIPLDYGLSFRDSDSKYFVIEGDEYDTAFFDKVPKFIHYKPRTAILTSVEFDHADIYADLDAVKNAFRMLFDKMPNNGLLVACVDSENVFELCKEARCKVVTYGVGADVRSGAGHIPTYQICNRTVTADGKNKFEILWNPSVAAPNSAHQKGDGNAEAMESKIIADVTMDSPGLHNAQNACAVIAVANELGWNVLDAVRGLQEFGGVKRRQEVIGTPKGVTLIEDFAHHPTAVKVTIDAIKEKYAGRKLFCLFEPRSATSRRKVFQKDYVAAFQSADNVIIAKAYDQSKISETDRFSTDELVADLKKSGLDAAEGESVDAIVAAFKKSAKPNDVVLIMSNGGFGGIYKRLTSEL